MNSNTSEGIWNMSFNNLFKQFLFCKLIREEIKDTQHLLNDKPRKVLDWETSYETFVRPLKNWWVLR